MSKDDIPLLPDGEEPSVRRCRDIPEAVSGSRVSLSSCNSVRIHRSGPADDIASASDNEKPGTKEFHPFANGTARPIRTANAASHTGSKHKALEADAAITNEVQWAAPPNQDLSDYEVVALQYPEAIEPEPPASLESSEKHWRTPFHKWVHTLNRRRSERRHLRRLENSDQTRTSEISDGTVGRSASRRHSSSISSFAYVSGVRDASISGAGTSIVVSSRKHRARSSKRLSKTDRSSRASYSVRYSEDDRPQSQADPTILERYKHRRRILEELIETEEGYIGDIKYISKAYLILFAPNCSTDPGLRMSMYSTMQGIVQLHDELLGELHAAVPKSEYAGVTPVGYACQDQKTTRGLDVVPENKTNGTSFYEYSGLTASSKTAAAVARVFAKHIQHFSIYQEYGAKYRMVIDDFKKINSSNPRWEQQQRGLEAMASYLSYARGPAGRSRALSIEDLFAKPVQRACRYPLLFKELLKATPVYDCPQSHSDIENVYSELEGVAKAMNEAMDDPVLNCTLQRTWLLQQRLRFLSKGTGRIRRDTIPSFGRIELYGVLYVCWQPKYSFSVEGRYMIGLLYRHCLCLAVAERIGKMYTLQACIPLDSCSIEKADNGQGLQCHTPFTWKIAFECKKNRLYEILLTTGTQAEETEWKHRLKANRSDTIALESPPFEYLALKMKPVSEDLKARSISGRPAMRRSRTEVDVREPMYQVILKNTRVGRESTQELPKHSAINRSKSLQADSRVFVLAASQRDRTSLESHISDVWTRDILFSSEAASRHHKRRSASSIMKKINVTSLASTFGRRSISRSASYRTVDKIGHDTPEAPRQSVLPPLLPEVDLAIKAGLSQMLSRRHDKTNHVDVTVRERGSTDASTSLDKDRDQMYLLAGLTERSSGLHDQEPKKSMRAPAESVPRYSVTGLGDEIGHGKTHRSKGTSPGPQGDMSDLSRTNSGTPSTAQLSISNSAIQMMPPLTPQAGRAAATRHGRHWLLHRSSFHRPPKPTMSKPGWSKVG